MADSNIVVAKQSFYGAVKGQVMDVREGDLFEADHPAVSKWPDMFAPPVLRFPVARKGRVEQATAAPGEKRKR